MIHLHACIASHLLSSPSTSAIPTLRCLICAPAPALSPNPGFAVDDYLIGTCGLTGPQALKASTKLSHVKSPANPDAVLAFLAGLGLSSAKIAAAVVKDPKFLCAGVERTLAPVVVGLTDLGLSSPEIARLLSIAPERFRCRSIVSRMQCYLPLFGSVDKILAMVKRRYFFSAADFDKVVKPNLMFLQQECGLDTCDIAKLCDTVSNILTTKQERLQGMAVHAEGIGVPRGCRMFRQALQAVAFLSKENIAAKLDYLKKTFSWSDAQVSIALTKSPMLLKRSKDMMWRRSEFLISELGLEPAYIAHRPVITSYNIERRLRPRYYVLKFLKANGFLDQNRDYYNLVNVSEQVFLKKFIYPHKEAAPHLAEDYEAACRGELPTRFRFT